MANFDVSTVASQINPLAPVSLSDMLNTARGAQAYQQAQQINPLLLQQQQAATQQAQQNLAVSQEDYARRLLNGVANMQELKPDAKGNYDDSAWKATVKMLRNSGEAANLPKHPSNFMGQLEAAVENKDYKTAEKLINLSTKTSGTTSEQYQANLPQFNVNALGVPYLTNRAAGTVSAPMQQGQGTIVPTTPGVQNFNDYQKDLTNRVAGGTQIDLRLNEAENLMKQFKPGAGARTYVDIAQKLQAIGAPQDLVDKVAKGDLAAAQSMNKFIAQSVTAGIGSMQGNPTANMMNDYLKNNPDIASDPRALQRFFDFAHKQNEMAYEEQNFLTNKIKNKEFNPDTHVNEAQQHILNTFVKPQQNKPSVTPVAKATDSNGKVWIKYSDGSVRPQ
jgi:hypothetical protein